MIVFQLKPQFQPSSKGGQNASTSSSAKCASEPVDQLLSYAEYIVQSKSNVAAPPQRAGPSTKLRTEGDGVTNVKQSVSSAPGGCETAQDCPEGTEGGSGGVKRSEETQVAGTDQKEGNCQRSDQSLSLGPKPVGSGSSIIVSPRQVCLCKKSATVSIQSSIHSLHILVCIHGHYAR